MTLHQRFGLSIEAPASAPEWDWPDWCLRMALRLKTGRIERIEAEIRAEFAVDTLEPLYREVESLGLERDALLRRLENRRGA